jgi:putative ABC transport system permease protein
LGGVAVALAFSGVVGVSGYFVSSRISDLGLRLALGAGRQRLVRGVVWNSVLPASIGAGIGVAVATFVASPLSAFLFQTSPRSPTVLVSVPILIVLAVAGVSVLSGRRILRIDPAGLLRGRLV